MNLTTAAEHKAMNTLDVGLATAVLISTTVSTMQASVTLFLPEWAERVSAVCLPVQFIMGLFAIATLLLRHRQSQKIINRYAKIQKT